MEELALVVKQLLINSKPKPFDMELNHFKREPECFSAFSIEMLESLERSLYAQYKQIEKLYNAAVIDFQDSQTVQRLEMNFESNRLAWSEVRDELENRADFYLQSNSVMSSTMFEDYIFNIRVSTAPLSKGQG